MSESAERIVWAWFGVPETRRPSHRLAFAWQLAGTLRGRARRRARRDAVARFRPPSRPDASQARSTDRRVRTSTDPTLNNPECRAESAGNLAHAERAAHVAGTISTPRVTGADDPRVFAATALHAERVSELLRAAPPGPADPNPPQRLVGGGPRAPSALARTAGASTLAA